MDFTHGPYRGRYTGDATVPSGGGAVPAVPEGNGTFVCDAYTYRGEWRSGVAAGSGATTYANGDVHTGGYADSRRNGHGVMVRTTLQ